MMANNPLLRGREEWFSYDLLDQDLNLISRDIPMGGGELNRSIHTAIGEYGSVTWTKDRDIPWFLYHLRVNYHGAGVVDPLMTFTVSAPEEAYSGKRSTFELSLLDTTAVLEEDEFGGASYAVPAGTVVTDKVVEIIQSTGWQHFVIDPSPLALSTGIFWEENVTKRKMVNDLLAAINYWSLKADPMGNLVSSRYVAPGDRSIAYSFTDGPEGIYLPGWRRTKDMYKVPNRVVCVQRVEGDQIPLRAVVELDSFAPDSPLSFANRGRWKTRTYQDIDAPDEETLIARATRLLIEAQQVTDVVEFSHPWMPNVNLNQVVEFSHRTSEGVLRGVVQAQKIKPTRAGMFRSTVRGLL